MAKKRDVRSEAAMIEAIKQLKRNTKTECYAYPYFPAKLGSTEVHIFSGIDGAEDEVLAIFDLRDCYRKRKPLKGIAKTMRKVIQPKRRKK